MRKIILFTFVCALSLLTQAQTNFQSLSYVDALALAKKGNKHVFIDFYTDWCAPCKRMAKDVFPQKEVGDYLNARYVCLQQNAQKKGKELAKKFSVKAYPTFIVTDTEGNEKFRIVGGMGADQFINRMIENTDPECSPERIAERYLAGERTPRVVEFYISGLMRNNKYKEGSEIVEDYFNSLSDEQRMQTENLFIYLRYTINWSDPKAQFFISHLKDFNPSSQKQLNRHFYFLYQNEAKRYFLASILNEEFDKRQYQYWKQQVSFLPEKEQKAHKPIFELIEIRMAGNLKKFIKTCIKEFDYLNVYQQEVLTKNIDKLIEHENRLSLKQTVKYLKKQLNELPLNTAVFSHKFLEKTEAVLND